MDETGIQPSSMAQPETRRRRRSISLQPATAKHSGRRLNMSNGKQANSHLSLNSESKFSLIPNATTANSSSPPRLKLMQLIDRQPRKL